MTPRRDDSAETIERRVFAFVESAAMVARGSKILVAVSGGSDSLCLLYVLHALSVPLKARLHVAHLDHGLRGENSRLDAAFVGEISAMLGIPFTTGIRDVSAYRSEMHLSLEEAAREVRYAFLAEVAAKESAALVAVGHTKSDNAETVIMHVVRGSGLDGLRGLRPSVEIRTGSGEITVIRPLLEIGKIETESYCAARGLIPRLDETNRSNGFTRNKVRRRLLPVMKGMNPAVEDSLARLGKIVSDEADFIERQASLAWERVASRKKGAILFSRQELKRLHPSVKRRIFRRAIAEFVSNLKDIEDRHIEVLLKATDARSGLAFNLPWDLVFAVEHDRFVLGRDVDTCRFPDLNGETVLNVPGETSVSRWIVSCSMDSYLEPIESIPVDSDDGLGETGQGVISAVVDMDGLGGAISVRAIRRGDRFHPLGLGVAKKVSDFMIDRRIPRGWRGRVPLVVSGGNIIWVVGYRLDEKVKVTQATKRTLTLRFFLRP